MKPPKNTTKTASRHATPSAATKTAAGDAEIWERICKLAEEMGQEPNALIKSISLQALSFWENAGTAGIDPKTLRIKNGAICYSQGEVDPEKRKKTIEKMLADIAKMPTLRNPSACFADVRYGIEIAPGVTLQDQEGKGGLIYLEIQNAQVELSVRQGAKGKESNVVIAIPRKIAEKFLPVRPEPSPKTKSAKPKTDAEARAEAIRNGWEPLLKHFPEMGKA